MHQDLHISHLRALVTVHDLGGFRRAAEELCLSQPAVSHQIRHLCKLVGGPVFTSTGRELRLSPQGEALLVCARRIVGLNDEIVASLTALETGRVRVPVSIVDQLDRAPRPAP